MEMQKLTINGQTFTVADPDALHPKDVEGMIRGDQQQFLTPQQQAQARANIGALGAIATVQNGVLVVSLAVVEDNILKIK